MRNGSAKTGIGLGETDGDCCVLVRGHVIAQL